MYINKAKKIVIKLGSSTVVDRKGNFNKSESHSLVTQTIMRLRSDDWNMLGYELAWFLGNS